MGAVIEALATWRPPAGKAVTSVETATRAAAGALREAGAAPGSVDLVISTGVFRDANVYEPAMGPFVQAGIGANPDLARGAPGTFSFDVGHGGCGFLTGLHVADGLIGAGAHRRAVVVASDASPETEDAALPGLSGIGAAALLAPGNDQEGVLAFETETFPEYADHYSSRGRWHAGRHLLRVERHASFVQACAEAGERTTLGFLERRARSLADFDLLVPAAAPEGFADAFLARPGLQGARAARPPAGVSFGHTSAAACAMADALESSRDRGEVDLLVVAAGAGLTIALLWYRVPARAGHGKGSDRC